MMLTGWNPIPWPYRDKDPVFTCYYLNNINCLSLVTFRIVLQPVLKHRSLLWLPWISWSCIGKISSSPESKIRAKLFLWVLQHITLWDNLGYDLCTTFLWSVCSMIICPNMMFLNSLRVSIMLNSSCSVEI